MNSIAPLHVVSDEPALVRLDIGCGKRKEEGWVGVDAIDFGQEHVVDVREGLPFAHKSVDAVRSSHFLEHLTGPERVKFFNELYRVMKVGATAQMITPHWSHACAYGDPTHAWPPISEWYALYLNKEWREREAPHVSYDCDFDYTVAVSWDGRIAGRNAEYMQMAMASQINAARDLIITLTRRE